MLDATWYLTANNNGLDWGDAKSWVAGLGIGTFGEWTLPALEPTCQGFNCANSQMAELYYHQLGNPANPQGGEMSNTGPFKNLESNDYWTATASIWTTPSAWYFNTYDGYQSQFWQSDQLFASAIRPGDVLAVVPEPGTTMVLLAGVAGAVIVRRRKTLTVGGKVEADLDPQLQGSGLHNCMNPGGDADRPCDDRCWG